MMIERTLEIKVRTSEDWLTVANTIIDAIDEVTEGAVEVLMVHQTEEKEEDEDEDYR